MCLKLRPPDDDEAVRGNPAAPCSGLELTDEDEEVKQAQQKAWMCSARAGGTPSPNTLLRKVWRPMTDVADAVGPTTFRNAAASRALSLPVTVTKTINSPATSSENGLFKILWV